MTAILNFRIFAKNGKTQICFYLLNRAKIFPSPKMAAILNFRIFAKNGKTQIFFYLLNRASRAISSKFSTHRVSKECTLCNFQKIFPSPHMAAILNFRIFAQNGKTQFYCVNTTYLVDRCICPAPCRSRQTLEKNVLSWALAGTGSVLFTRQVAVQPTCRYTAHACACALPLFVWRHFKKLPRIFIETFFSFSVGYTF